MMSTPDRESASTPEMSAPLTPADCNLRDFPFMPLDIQRLRRSKAWLKAKRNPALGFYMINLWTASWHEVPAASLEDDDEVLADLAVCDLDVWEQVKADVLRGWIKCSDGRLYHPVVAEKACESWESKVAYRDRMKAARDAKAAKKSPKAASEIESMTGSNTDSITASDTGSITEPMIEPVIGQSTGLKGEGQGEGEGQGNIKPPIPPKGGKAESKKKPTISLRAFFEQCREKGEIAIPENDPVFDYAEKAGISLEVLRLHWLEFRARYTEEGAKRYKDWRMVYRKSVRGNWFRLWYIGTDGTIGLTTVGEQAKRTHGKDAA